MFNKGKISSDLQLKKETLEAIGYVFDSISKKSGWTWSAQLNESMEHFSSESEAVQDAWNNAGERTQSVLSIPAETWERMSSKEQKEMILEALAVD